MDKKLYLVIPAYNEQATIGAVVEQWYPVVEQIGPAARLVVINDGSQDATYQILQRYAASRPQLVPLTKTNSGHGATLLFGYRYALAQGAEYIFQTDADGQTEPAEFGHFWRLRDRYDLIIGHRQRRQDGLARMIVTKTLKLTLRLCFGVTVTDANTPFRLFSAATLADAIKLIPPDFNLANVLLTVIYHKKALRVQYLPITFKPRQGGVNSLNLWKIIKIGVRAVRDFRKINDTLTTI